jgi:hypothetical protein
LISSSFIVDYCHVCLHNTQFYLQKANSFYKGAGILCHIEDQLGSL